MHSSITLPQFDLKKNGSVDACHRKWDPAVFPSGRIFSFGDWEKGKMMNIQKVNDEEQKERLKCYLDLIWKAEAKKEEMPNADDEL